jgi:hypothetical protein
MRSSHTTNAVSAQFTDDTLVSCAGLVPLIRLTENIDLPDLINHRVDLGIPVDANSDAKALSRSARARARRTRRAPWVVRGRGQRQ